MILKSASKEHCKMLWEWVNDPAVRRSAFNQNPIAYNDHVKWFDSKLNASDCFIYIAYEENGDPIGQIRFDLKESTVEIDISVAQEHRGKGYAVGLIREGVICCRSDSGRNHFTAYIRPENKASVRSFEKAGFYFEKECAEGYMLTLDLKNPKQP